jgi:hypothetical protein
MCFFELIEVHQHARESNLCRWIRGPRLDGLAIKIGSFFESRIIASILASRFRFLEQQFGLVGRAHEFHFKRTPAGKQWRDILFESCRPYSH